MTHLRNSLKALTLTSPILLAIVLYITLHWWRRPVVYLADALIVFQVLVYGALLGSELQRSWDRERRRPVRPARTSPGEDEIDRLTTSLNGVVPK